MYSKSFSGARPVVAAKSALNGATQKRLAAM